MTIIKKRMRWQRLESGFQDIGKELVGKELGLKDIINILMLLYGRLVLLEEGGGSKHGFNLSSKDYKDSRRIWKEK